MAKNNRKNFPNRTSKIKQSHQKLLLSIGTLANMSEISVQAIRLYQQLGLIPKPQILPSGYRRFSQDYVEVIKFIKMMKSLGFPLKEIKKITPIIMRNDTPKHDRIRFVRTKILEVKERIKNLEDFKQTLQGLIS